MSSCSQYQYLEAEEGRSLWVRGQTGLQSEFQDRKCILDCKYHGDDFKHAPMKLGQHWLQCWFRVGTSHVCKTFCISSSHPRNSMSGSWDWLTPGSKETSKFKKKHSWGLLHSSCIPGHVSKDNSCFDLLFSFIHFLTFSQCNAE